MTLDDAVMDACRAVGVTPPKRLAPPGRWARCDTYERNGKGDGEVMIHADRMGAQAVNWQTQQRASHRLTGEGSAAGPALRDKAAEARARDAERRERAEVASICETILKACRHEVHPYLSRKGFPAEAGLVSDDPRAVLPSTPLGAAIGRAMPEPDGPYLIVPGRVAGRVTTLQFITGAGEKKNILRGAMSGASHRIAQGPRLVVCEGIATALSVRAALRLLAYPATVLCAFSASNVAKVAAAGQGFIAADHDRPQDALNGAGAGAFYAAGSGRPWVMPPALGDFNDMHQSAGLRAVALHLREALMG